MHIPESHEYCNSESFKMYNNVLMELDLTVLDPVQVILEVIIYTYRNMLKKYRENNGRLHLFKSKTKADF